MGITKYFVKQGLVQKSKADILGGFNLNRFFKWMADKVHIAYYDDCCDSAKTQLPVSFNTVTGGVEYFDGSANVNANGIVSDTTNITFGKAVVQKRTGAAINVTATATAAQLAGGLITSTSAAAVALTLPTATALATEIGAVQGTTFDFLVDNSAGANTVTVTVNTGITAVTAVITGGATLTVGSGVVGQFRIIFTSATVAKIARIV